MASAQAENETKHDGGMLIPANDEIGTHGSTQYGETINK